MKGENMAKTRVYELARKLNMSNQQLMDKLHEIGVPVNSHMGSIDDDVIGKFTKNDKKTDIPMIEETRVQSTVIRRRRKKVNIEKKDSEKRVSENTDKIGEKKPDKKIEKIEKEIDQPEMSEKKSRDTEKETTPENEKKPKKKRKKRRKPKDVSAKIIKLPDKPVEQPHKAEEEFPKPEEKDENEELKTEVAKISESGKKKKSDSKQKTWDETSDDEKKDSRKKSALSKKKADPDKGSFNWKKVIEGTALTDMRRGKKKKNEKKGKKHKGEKTQITTPKAIKRRIKVDNTIVLSELGKRMGIKANELIAKLMNMGVMATVNQTIDFDTAALVASEFGFEVEKASFEEEEILKIDTDDSEKQTKRLPIVTIMGHVDHGKTSLLDVIRKTRVIDTESGGITQHIGAYSVKTGSTGITFLDTPGHEAFTSMRARGAGVTDIVVLVVAADDGVMPQTIEAINHSNAAKVPIIVAINKMDKPDADPERVIRELSEHGLMSEAWGGETIFVKVSAKKNEGIDELLEMILLQAEMLELKANPDKLATGYVIEAKLDSGKGPVATVLVQDGSLRTGDFIVCGIHFGKVRAMINDIGQQVDSASPSIPVEVLGLSGVPVAGDRLIATSDEKSAKQVSSYRARKQRSLELAKSSRMSLEALFEKMQKGEVRELNLIVKADVQGSIEALRESLMQLSIDEVEINIVHSATGTITESDISLATVSNAIIIGFNVRPNANVTNMAKEENVDIRFYDVIYNAINDIKDAVVGMMKSTYEEVVLGRAEVREVFTIPKIGAIAGCYITDGKIERNKNVRLLREGIILYDGKISSLKRFKDDAKEVTNGYECGIGIEKYNDIKLGDVIECYYMEEVKPKL